MKVAAGVTLTNNIIYGNPYVNLGSAAQAIQNTNLINIDPGFVDEANQDFHLRAGSPAIDAGTVLMSVPDDFDGVPRPQGARPDMGAYESDASGQVTLSGGVALQ